MSNFLEELRRRNVLRVAIGYAAASWLLIQVLETVLPIFDLPETSIRLLVVALLVAFLPAMALAWAFEWSPTGIRSQAEVDRDTTAAQPASRLFDRSIIFILSLAVLYFAMERFVFNAATFSNSATIAVLPFADMTESQDQAYFGDGIAEELLNLLAKNPALQVASRTSSFSFRDSVLPIGEIAVKLGVAYVLEGSVRRSGDRVRVTAQLISANDDYHLWSETYDSKFGDIFSIQDDISGQIADALEVQVLDGAPAVKKTDPEAYALFLQAGYVATRADREGMERGVELYKRVLDIDPQYAPAWSELSAVYSNLTANGFLEFNEGNRLAIDAALRSITADSGHGPGYSQLSWSDLWYSGNLSSAVANMQQAVNLDPTNLITLNGAAVLLLNLGQHEKSLALHEYIVARSPLDTVAFFNLALAYKYDGRLDEAESTIRKLLDLSPQYGSGLYNLGEILLLKNQYADALAVWQTETDESYLVKGRALALYALGRTEEADAALEAFVENWGEQWPSEVAHIYAYRGDLDNAFVWLEKEFDTYGTGGWGEWQLQPLYANLRSDPRWHPYLTRAGANDDQLSQYELTVALPTQRSK